MRLQTRGNTPRKTGSRAESCLVILVMAFLLSLNSCSDDSTAPGGGEDEPSYCDMEPLPNPAGTIITVKDVSELFDAVNAANVTGNLTILLMDGTYQIPVPLYIAADDVAIRSISGNRDNVTIRGDGMDGSLGAAIYLNGKQLTVADMTLGWVNGPGILVVNDADDCLLHNLRIVDTEEHMIKVAQSGGGTTLTERGEVRWCLFEYAAGEGPQEYIGGIMAMEADSWSVHHNTIRGIKAPGGETAGPAIMFWTESANTVIEHNTIYNCDRGIMFGLGSGDVSHTGGMIRNNMVHTDKDVGISLESAESASVYNNTVFTENYISSIEYRYAQTQFASIINNLTSGAITGRDGGTGVLETNFTSAQLSWFIDARGGDLRLADSQADVVDKGTDLTAVPIDIDCKARPKGDSTDIGADEY
jgi:hypothetical protein